jgi:hypothetical protein
MFALTDKEIYFEKCRTHDWFYDYSDDYRVWRAGETEHKHLVAAYRYSPELEKIYRAWADFYFEKRLFKPEMADFV